MIQISLWQRIKNCFDFTSTRIKTISLALSIIYFVVIAGISMMRFNNTDLVPQLKPINTEELKKLGAFTTRVKIGMFIKNFPVFDVSKNNFLVDAIVWFEFNSEQTNLDTVEKFSVDNGRIVSKSQPDIKMLDSMVFVKYNVMFEMKTDLNFHKFPFEDHRLPILISNDFVTPDEMIFVVDANAFEILSKIAPAGWRFSDMSVDAGIQPLPLDKLDKSKKTENPKALFVLNLMKTTPRRALVIFIPLYSAMFLSLLAFVMNAANVVGKITLATTALTGILGYRFVIEQMIPPVGYFTTTDLIYLLLLIMCFINFAIQLLLTRYYMVEASAPADPAKKEGIPFLNLRLEKWNAIIFTLMLFLLVAATTYIILI